MRPLFSILVLLTVSSCSLQKMALRSATPVFEESTQSLMKENNWDFFRASSPGNIKFLELLWDQDRENLRQLAVLVKSYSGYAFGVHETLVLRDDILQKDRSKARQEAIFFYTRALDYGLIYLDAKGIKRSDLLGSDEKLSEKINKLDEEDLVALLYTAQAWGSLINLQKDNIVLVSQISKVKIFFDHVCKLRPNIDHNVCDIFYAQYEVSRPKMLGGNPEKGEKLFMEAMQKYPHNLLIRLAYIQYALIPSMDAEKYEKIAVDLREEFVKWGDVNRDNLENTSPYRKSTELNLFNAIAKKRFEIIERYKKKIF